LTQIKPAEVRFYFDADVLGLGKAVVRLRPDATYPGDPGGILHKRERPACVITKPRTDDDVWIPLVAAESWLIITRDSKIQERRAEIAAVRDNGARMVALSSREATSTWAQLEILMCRWRSIEALLSVPGPLIRSASRSGLATIKLD